SGSSWVSSIDREQGAGSREQRIVLRRRLRLPAPGSLLPLSVSNCHTGTEALDCPVKYAPPLPPADLRDPRGPDRCADRPGRRGLGARRANGGAVGGGAFGVIAAVPVAGHLSRQLSRPIDELVGWTRLIRRRMPLPAGPPTRGAPEFEALRQALRELATALDAARERELEAERLRAFREVARRVAHEIKNPLTAMRIAVDQLRRSGGPVERRTDVAVEVIGAETERLDQLAKEFAEFGRLPEGPRSEVDLVDLLMDLGKSAVPSEVDVSVRANGEPCKLLGHYDPLRRAFANLLRNAAEAMGGRGSIEIAVSRDGAGLA